jgi:hypothetical protein
MAVAVKRAVFWVITPCTSWLGVSEEHIISIFRVN